DGTSCTSTTAFRAGAWRATGASTMSRSRFGLFVVVVFTTLLISTASAPLPTYGVGRSPSPDETKVWDLTIPPDGRGLPPGSGTAKAGEAVYLRRCAACHGKEGAEAEDNPRFSQLCGGRGTLATNKPVLTVGSFWQNA